MGNWGQRKRMEEEKGGIRAEIWGEKRRFWGKWAKRGHWGPFPTFGSSPCRGCRASKAPTQQRRLWGGSQQLKAYRKRERGGGWGGGGALRGVCVPLRQRGFKGGVGL